MKTKQSIWTALFKA